MALSKTYYVDANYAYPDTSSAILVMKSFLWCLKALLCGNVTGTNGTSGAPPAGSRWTVVSSSNSVTSGASDLWLAAFDATKLVRAAAGVAHSWILLQSPAGMGPFYLLIDWGTGSDSTANFYGSRTAFTGGSTTARPTSTAEIPLAGWTKPDLTTGVTHRITRVTDADGMFHVMAAKAGSGLFGIWFHLGKLIETVTGDLYPEVMLLEANITGRGAGANPGSVLLNYNSIQGVGMRNYSNSVLSDSGAACGLILPTAAWIARTLPNAANSKQDGWPLYHQMTWSSAAAQATRGRLPDLAFVNSWKSVAEVSPSTGASERVLVGNTYVPNGGVTLLV